MCIIFLPVGEPGFSLGVRIWLTTILTVLWLLDDAWASQVCPGSGLMSLGVLSCQAPRPALEQARISVWILERPASLWEPTERV